MATIAIDMALVGLHVWAAVSQAYGADRAHSPIVKATTLYLSEVNVSSTRLLNGWARIFAWVVVVVACLGILPLAVGLVGGPNSLAVGFNAVFSISFGHGTAPGLNPAGIATQLAALGFAVGCWGALTDNRSLAGFGVIAGFAVLGFQILSSVLALFLHSTLEIPLMFPIYLAFLVVLDRSISRYDQGQQRLARQQETLQGA